MAHSLEAGKGIGMEGGKTKLQHSLSIGRMTLLAASRMKTGASVLAPWGWARRSSLFCRQAARQKLTLWETFWRIWMGGAPGQRDYSA